MTISEENLSAAHKCACEVVQILDAVAAESNLSPLEQRRYRIAVVYTAWRLILASLRDCKCQICADINLIIEADKKSIEEFVEKQVAKVIAGGEAESSGLIAAAGGQA